MPKTTAAKVNDFVAPVKATSYRFRLGDHVASSLSGFIAGIVVATIIWLAVAYIVQFVR